jgi:hypothetical protein
MNPGTHKLTGSYQILQALPATILLVEDEPTVREITPEALEMGEHRIMAADGPVRSPSGFVGDL